MKRYIQRNDVLLLAGRGVALFVVFSEGLSTLLEYAREVEQSSGLRLLPALIILVGVFVVHQYRKRHQERAEARVATVRVAEMERLVAFGQALQRALDLEAIRRAAVEHLPKLVPERSAWAMVRTGTHWTPLAVVGDSSPLDRERAARRALGEADPEVGQSGDDIGFPMIVGAASVGVLGVGSQPPLTDHHVNVLTAAASLLAVSIKNAELFREAHDAGVRDTLTGCYLRGHALDVVDAELRRARRSQQPVTLVLFDLDHFKAINDRYGHLAGDAVLAAVGERMQALLRGSDLKCRYGGEEFLILLPEAPLAGARRVADALRHDLEARPVRWNDEDIRVTASFGITAAAPGEVDTAAIIARADQALYRAKARGRNCIHLSEAPSSAA